MTRSHPTDGELRALLDRELPWLGALALRRHLRRCPRCRATAEGLKETARRAARLLRVADVAPRPAAARRPAALAAAAGVTGLAAALVLGLARAGGDAAGTTERDICCWDLDGGGPGDDGVLTFSAPNEVVSCVVLYDDRDGSRSFTSTDRVRFASRGPACPTAAPQS